MIVESFGRNSYLSPSLSAAGRELQLLPSDINWEQIEKICLPIQMFTFSRWKLWSTTRRLGSKDEDPSGALYVAMPHYRTAVAAFLNCPWFSAKSERSAEESQRAEGVVTLCGWLMGQAQHIQPLGSGILGNFLRGRGEKMLFANLSNNPLKYLTLGEKHLWVSRVLGGLYIFHNSHLAPIFCM